MSDAIIQGRSATGHHRLTRKEARRILQRASELDARKSDLDGYELEELRTAALDAGISEEALAEALRREGGRGTGALSAPLLEVPSEIVVTKVVPHGCTAREIEWLVALLGELEVPAGREPGQRAGVSAWSMTDGCQVQVEGDGSRTGITVRLPLGRLIATSALGTIGAGAVWGLAFAAIADAGSLLPTFVTVGAGAGLAVWGGYWTLKYRSLKSRVGRLAEKLARGIGLLSNHPGRDERE